MENATFRKILGFGLMLIALVFGYLMLPDVGDLKAKVEKEKAGPFLKGFHAVERPEKTTKLPEVKILSREGRDVDLASITNGKIVIVNFWASWCAPCIEELPSLAKFQETHGEILVLPISLDINKRPEDLAKFFAGTETRDLRWFYDNTGQIRRALNLTVYPATYVLDKQGRIIYELQGPNDWASREASDFANYLVQYIK